MRKQISFSLKMSFVIFFSTLSGAQADQTVVSGGGIVRQEYDSNIYRTNRDRVTEWTTSFSPTMSISDISQHHNLFFKYTPSVIYSQLTDKERWDHNIYASLDKDWSEHVSTYLKETFIRAEDPFDDDEVGIKLSDSRGRNRYWLNNVAVGLGYDYAKDSFIKLSYVNTQLDNEKPEADDYIKHRPGVSLAHLFSQHWQAQADYFFTKGNFEEEDDLENHTGDLYVFYYSSPASKIFVHGGYTANRYEGLKEDYDLNRVSLGFEHQLSSTFDYRLEAGGVFLIRDQLEDKDAFYYKMSLNKKLQYGALSMSGEGGIDEQQFDGTSDRDVSRYWQVEAGFQYSLTQNLLSSLKCSFREDRYWERTPEETEEKVEAEASLSYSFGRWYTASVRYAFSRQDADIPVRCYDDSRVFLELGFNKDFFNW